MNNNKNKIYFSFVTLLTMLVLTACGNLSDPDSIWNQTQEVETVETPSGSDTGAMSYIPGTFDGISDIRGYGGPISVTVTIDENGRISYVEVTEHRESDGFYQRAFDTIIPLILNAQSAEVSVDAASGATYSADALLSAVNDALSQAGGTPGASISTVEANFTPGVFDATSDIRGYGGPISVAITIDENGYISHVEVTEHRESDGFYQRAFETIIPLILAAQSTEVSVDAASGATYSADALLDAVDNALNDAR